MAKKTSDAPASGISLASSEPVLFYTGGPIYSDAPARDLTAADLAYLWLVAALRESGGEPVGYAEPAHLEALAEQLVASGAFTVKQLKAPAEPAAPDTPVEATEEPAGPAEASE